MERPNITSLHNDSPSSCHKSEYVSAYGNSAFRNIQSGEGLEKTLIEHCDGTCKISATSFTTLHFYT
jgi:hypothetical protein